MGEPDLAVLAAAPVAMLALEQGGRILYLSRGALTLLGDSPAPASGANFLTWIEPDCIPVFEQAFTNAVELRLESSLEVSLRRSATSFLPARVTLSPLATPSPGELLCTLEDLSPYRHLEETLRESEDQFHSTFHLAAVGMVQLDALTGRFLQANARYCELTGYSLNELRELRPRDLTHPHDQAADRVLLERFFKREIPYYFTEKRYVRKDGRVIWVQINGSLISDGHGQPVRTIAVIHDITERKIAELSQRESAAWLRQAMQVANLGVFEHDHRSQTLTFSPEMRRLGGWERDEPITLELAIARIHPDDRDRVRQAIARSHATDGDGSYDIEHRVLIPDGSVRCLRVKGQTLFEESEGRTIPVCTLGVALDITEESEWRIWMKNVNEQLERKIGQRTQELEQERQAAVKLAQKAEAARYQAELSARALVHANAELEQFAYIASHDLQEPLRKIQAFGDLLLSSHRAQLGEQGRDYLDRMSRSAARMQTLINDLLTLSRIVRKGQPFEPVDLNDIIEEVLGDLESRLRESGASICVSELPKLMADATQLRQLFQNLLGNSLKYRRANVPPRITVSARRIAGDDEKNSGDEDSWVLEFTDNGIGFDQADAMRIFQPFQRLHGLHEYEGTGMGLAICRRIVERHKGTISAQGVRGSGATFVVMLPATQSSRETGDDAAG